MMNNLSIADENVPMHMVTLLSVDEILLPRYVNRSTNFREDGFFLFKLCELFYLRSCRAQHNLLLASVYTAEIRLGQV